MNMPSRKRGESNDLRPVGTGGRHRPGSLVPGGAAHVQQLVAVAFMGCLDAAFGGFRSSLERHFDLKIFLSGFFANGIFAVFLCYFGYRLGMDLYYVAMIAFGLRIFNNIAIIRRLLMGS